MAVTGSPGRMRTTTNTATTATTIRTSELSDRRASDLSAYRLPSPLPREREPLFLIHARKLVVDQALLPQGSLQLELLVGEGVVLAIDQRQRREVVGQDLERVGVGGAALGVIGLRGARGEQLIDRLVAVAGAVGQRHRLNGGARVQAR